MGDSKGKAHNAEDEDQEGDVTGEPGSTEEEVEAKYAQKAPVEKPSEDKPKVSGPEGEKLTDEESKMEKLAAEKRKEAASAEEVVKAAEEVANIAEKAAKDLEEHGQENVLAEEEAVSDAEDKLSRA